MSVAQNSYIRDGGFTVETVDLNGNPHIREIGSDLAGIIGSFMIDSERNYEAFCNLTLQPARYGGYETHLIKKITAPSKEQRSIELSKKILPPAEQQRREIEHYNKMRAALLDALGDDDGKEIERFPSQSKYTLDEEESKKFGQSLLEILNLSPEDADPVIRESTQAKWELSSATHTNLRTFLKERYFGHLQANLFFSKNLQAVLFNIQEMPTTTFEDLDVSSMLKILTFGLEANEPKIAREMMLHLKRALEKGNKDLMKLKVKQLNLMLEVAREAIFLRRFSFLEEMFRGIGNNVDLIESFFSRNLLKEISVLTNPKLQKIALDQIHQYDARRFIKAIRKLPHLMRDVSFKQLAFYMLVAIGLNHLLARINYGY